jgi:hypothetical protein
MDGKIIFHEIISQEDLDLLDAMAEILIRSNRETITKIDKLMERMDETHAMFSEASKR